MRNILFKMIEKQYKSFLKGPPYHYHPEILTVQYILPCFVASYLELENTDESNQAKEEYLRFVHQLVKSYEQQEYCMELENLDLRHSYIFYNTKDSEQNFQNSSKAIQKMSPFCFKNVLKGMRQVCAFKKDLQPWKCDKCERGVETIDCWFYQKHMISNRIYTSLDKLGKIPSASISYSAALGIIFNNMFCGSRADQNFEEINLFLMHRIGEKFYKPHMCRALAEPSSYLPSLCRYYEGLSDKQFFNLAIFVYIDIFFIARRTCEYQIIEPKNLQKETFPLDMYAELFRCLVAQDWWKLKILVSKGNVSKDGEDLSLIPLSLARKSKSCRELVIKVIGPKSGRIKMKRFKGTMFFPIKHCRRCGLVVSKHLKLCKECDENRDYPDRNYFCSKKCETLCLKKRHTEEHAQFLMMQLNMNS
jgi:hypothetical protein